MATAVGVPATARPSGSPQSPGPRRLRPPRWLDLRLVLGVLLVLGSVLVGVRVVSAADATVPVWAAADDLAAGTVLTAEDLVAVDVRLDAAAASYLSTAARPDGRTLARPVRAGELVPRSALDAASPLVQLALPVQAGYVPPSLRRGQLVDVYAVADATAGGAGADGGVGLVVGGAPMQAVSGRTDGVLSTPTTTVQVVLAVPADRVPGVLAAVGGRPLVVVVHGSVDGTAGDPGDGVSGPTATGAGATAVPTGSATAVPTGSVPTAGAPTPSGDPSAAPSGGAPVPTGSPAEPTGR